MKYTVILILLVSIVTVLSCATGDDPSSNYFPIPEPEPEPEPDPDPFDIIPEPPDNIWVSVKTNETITIAWDPVYNATYYKIYWDDRWYQWPLDEYQHMQWTNETTYTITLLQSLEWYYFEVHCHNYGGDSYAGAYIHVLTDEAYGTLEALKMGDAFWNIYVDGYHVGGIPSHLNPSFLYIDVLTGYRFIEIFSNYVFYWSTYEYLKKDETLRIPH